MFLRAALVQIEKLERPCQISGQRACPGSFFAVVYERNRRRVKELAAKAVDFAKVFVECKIAVLIVHDHRVARVAEVETNLMHPPGCDLDSNERRFRESLGHRKAGESTNRFAFPTGEG